MPASKKPLKEWIDLTKKALESLYSSEGVSESKTAFEMFESKARAVKARWTKKQFLEHLGKRFPD